MSIGAESTPIPHELTRVSENMDYQSAELQALSETSDETHSVNTEELYRIPLQSVNPTFGIVTLGNEIQLRPMTLKEQRTSKSGITVLFAVRMPGCGGCREHALQIAELARDGNVSVVAAVKETGVDDESLIEFYQKYFRHPIYKDEKWKVFHAMGGRKLSMFTVLRRAGGLFKRARSKGIKSTVRKGDFWTKGGVMVFDKRGELKYTQHEKFGVEFDMASIRNAIQQLQTT